MGSTGHPGSTIQGSARYLSMTRPAVVLLPRWTNNHYPMPGLNVVINLYKSIGPPSHPLYRQGIFSRQSITITIGLTIGCSDNRDNRLSGQSGKCAIGQVLDVTLPINPYCEVLYQRRVTVRLDSN